MAAQFRQAPVIGRTACRIGARGWPPSALFSLKTAELTRAANSRNYAVALATRNNIITEVNVSRGKVSPRMLKIMPPRSRRDPHTRKRLANAGETVRLARDRAGVLAGFQIFLRFRDFPVLLSVCLRGNLGRPVGSATFSVDLQACYRSSRDIMRPR